MTDKDDNIPLLSRYIKPSELIHFSEDLHRLIKSSDLLGLITVDEASELIYTDIILEDEEHSVVPYLVSAKPWSDKNQSRDEAHKPKSLKSKIRAEYRRLTKSYKTSSVLPDGFAWHAENLDIAILNLLECIEDRNKDIIYSSAYKVIAKIIESIMRHEFRRLILPFDDQPVDLEKLDKKSKLKLEDRLKQIDAFEINSTFIKKRIQRMKIK